jgi:hypothetical protein
MEISGQPKRHRVQEIFPIPRGFLIFMIVVSGWSLWRDLKHISRRFDVPRHMVGSFVAWGRFNAAFDVLTYLPFTCFFVSLVRSEQSRAERVWLALWISPILINPLKMLIPRYSNAIWWAELFLELVFLLAAIAMFLNWKPRPTLARCRARFGPGSEPPHAPEL